MIGFPLMERPTEQGVWVGHGRMKWKRILPSLKWNIDWAKAKRKKRDSRRKKREQKEGERGRKRERRGTK